MDRFRFDNTQGYDAADLAALNTAWEQMFSEPMGPEPDAASAAAWLAKYPPPRPCEE